MTGQTGVNPILASNVAWTELLKDIAELSGRSPVQGIDSYGFKLKDYAKFIAALGEFQMNEKTDPIAVLRGANDHLLSHLHFGFIIYGSIKLIFEIMELTDLKITSASMKNKGRVAIVTGTLKEWRDAIVNSLNSTIKRNYELRWVFNQCLDFFYQIGLNDIFHDYRKVAQQNGTYLLEYKK